MPECLQPRGCIVPDEPGFASTATKNLQAFLADGGIKGEPAEAFLKTCALYVQILSDEGDPTRPQKFQSESKNLAAACLKLQDAMRSLPGELVDLIEGYSALAAAGRLEETQIGAQGRSLLAALQTSPGVLAGLWLLSGAVAQLSGLTADRLSLSASHGTLTPQQALGRQLLLLVLRAYKERFSALPLSARDGWFCGFMDELARQCGAQCGHRAVAQAVSAFAKDG